MPRNRYAPCIRKAERAQTARQEQEVIDITKRLIREIAESAPAPATNTEKARRSLRLAHKRKHKAVGVSATPK